MKSLISVVIPVYQCSGCICELYKRLTSSLGGFTSDYTIIFVEDGGADESWPVICEISSKDDRVYGLQLSRNFGQHHAITAGLDVSESDWTVVMDCDLQDRPEDIQKLYKKALEGFDVVYAARETRHDSMRKRISSFIFYKVFNHLSDSNISSNVGNFCILSRRVVLGFRQIKEQARFFGGIINWLGFPQTSVSVLRDSRFQGKTSYDFRKLWKLATKNIIAFSDRPLRFMIQVGFFMTFCSLMIGSYIVYRHVFHGVSVEGWSSIITSIYFIGGFIISSLGIIGIYLGKALEEARKRPHYVVWRTTRSDHISE